MVTVLGRGAFGRGLGHKGGALMSGVSVLVKGPQELPRAFSRVRAAVYEPGGRPRQTESASALILDFSVSTTMRNAFLLCTSHPVCGTSVTAAWMG